ncbi:HIT family hydrolase [Sorangium cellulosum]|uniref:HIT family hydrolase n=1 Tax=Sorangium cellulosum TaxID=56 RepID=A0A4P2Q8Z1_SORCE|nr:HIT domain-containing protein [Sorangium cellulosum]AUX25533.1 HIT family hydrolase [Sorangium cellulosum]
MGNPLWAPWRIEYILAPKGRADCIFCGIPRASEQEQRSRLVVATTRRAFVMLNRYPFASGHLLVVPHAHVASLDALDAEDHEALFRLVRESATRLRAAVKCEGMNVGINLGTAAGAGIAEHLHVHIVPRWSGDTNFMPVLADVRVVPQALEATRDHLLSFFADLPVARIDGDHGSGPAARGGAP